MRISFIQVKQYIAQQVKGLAIAQAIAQKKYIYIYK